MRLLRQQLRALAEIEVPVTASTFADVARAYPWPVTRACDAPVILERVVARFVDDRRDDYAHRAPFRVDAGGFVR